MNFIVPEFPILSEKDLEFMKLEISLSEERSADKKLIPPTSRQVLDAVKLDSIIFPKREDFQLNEDKINDYLSLLDPDILEIVNILINKTRYVSATEVVFCLKNLFNEFISENKFRPFYVYFPSEFSSENIFVMFLWEILRTLDIKGFISSNQKFQDDEEINILLFDDCVFTGQNMDRTLFNLTIDNPETPITFHLFVPYVSRIGYNFVNESLNNPFKNSHNIHTLMWHTHTIIDDVLFDNNFIETCSEFYASRLPLYFDYKIPMTTCYYIYKGLDPKTRIQLGHLTNNPVTSEFKISAYEAYMTAINSL